jgi:hypothetical protein
MSGWADTFSLTLFCNRGRLRASHWMQNEKGFKWKKITSILGAELTKKMKSKLGCCLGTLDKVASLSPQVATGHTQGPPGFGTQPIPVSDFTPENAHASLPVPSSSSWQHRGPLPLMPVSVSASQQEVVVSSLQSRPKHVVVEVHAPHMGKCVGLCLGVVGAYMYLHVLRHLVSRAVGRHIYTYSSKDRPSSPGSERTF